MRCWSFVFLQSGVRRDPDHRGTVFADRRSWPDAFRLYAEHADLFAIVLATGIVVDDAIVVLENVERLMAEKKLSPKDAAIESMKEVTGAIVAIELVLVSVFVPVAFLGGLAGKLYQQFAVTVATAVTISGLIALTLTPALCALLLKPQHIESRLFRPFNRGFAWLTRTYLGGVRLTVRHAVIAVIIFVAILGADFCCSERCRAASCRRKIRVISSAR